MSETKAMAERILRRAATFDINSNSPSNEQAQDGEHLAELVLDRTAKCPFCGKPLKPEGTIFVEEGEWDGKSFSGERDVETLTCECGARIAVLDRGGQPQ